MTITHLVTHSGGFHADELLSSVVLTRLFPQAELLRSRDRELITPAPNKIIYDVGGAYDADAQIFDHHQRPAPLRERWHSAAGAGSVRAPCDAGRRRGRTTSGGSFSGASTMCGRLACLRRRAPCAMCVQCSLAARPVSCTAAAWTASLHDQRARARRLLAPRRTGRAGCTHAVGRHWPWSVRSRSLTATRRTVV